MRKSWLLEHLRIKRIVDRLNHSEEGGNVDGPNMKGRQENKRMCASVGNFCFN